MYHLCTNLYEGMKKGFFFTCLAFKGFALRNNFKQNKKQLQKKLLFSCLDSKAMPAKKKKLLGLSLPLFQNKPRNNRSPALTFVFRTSNQKVVLCTNEKLFFFCVFFIYQKTKLPTDKLFVFVCKQNHFEMRNRNQAKKKLNWSFCFFVDSSCLLPPQAKQNNALLQK